MTIFDQKYTTEKEDTTSPEHYLWTSVLSKAAHDAIFTSDWRESKMAIAWFKGKGSGFRAVCEMAGKDPNYVYQKMLGPIAQREAHMHITRNGGRYYVEKNPSLPTLPTGSKIYHSHYRGRNKRGPYKKKFKVVKKIGRPPKNLKMVLRGSKGGRPKLYVV
tara:strand:+ start:183 stop:665 length:483 start_codon:yes stop_codon:yes gene_type:complete